MQYVTKATRYTFLAAFVALVYFASTATALGGIFGEGYSSSLPGGPSAIYFRAFTIYTRQEACETSGIPAKLKILPNPIQLRIGDRIHRSNVEQHPSEIVVEAYDEHDAFLPAVPITVSTIDTSNITTSRSDWNYFEATKEGKAEVSVSWACSTADGNALEARASVVVSRVGANSISDQ
ncbi:MAG: hypothetical protein AAF662_06055 [Pseudomonadota bacterium]